MFFLKDYLYLLTTIARGYFTIYAAATAHFH